MNREFFQKILLIFLALFCISRPIASIVIFNKIGIFGLTIAELFAICFSYGLIVVVLLNGLTRYLGLIEIGIFTFILYCLLSILWGSTVREISRLILPLFLFLAVRLADMDINTLKKNYKRLFIAFFIPASISFIMILTQTSPSESSYWTGLVSFYGAYAGPHSLAHEMFIFSLVGFIYFYFRKISDKEKNLSNLLIYISFIFIIFNIYFSHTRTVYFGTLVLVFFYLLGRKRYITLLICLSIVFILIVVSKKTNLIFFDIIGPLTGSDITGEGYRGMGSGRLGLWQDALNEFRSLPFERLFLGIGLGKEILFSAEYFGASHNDLIALLLSLGIIGTILYFLIITCLITEILTSNCDRIIKFTFYGFLLAVLAMNFGSNSYLSRFQLAQYFFFLMGTFHLFKNIPRDENG